MPFGYDLWTCTRWVGIGRIAMPERDTTHVRLLGMDGGRLQNIGRGHPGSCSMFKLARSRLSPDIISSKSVSSSGSIYLALCVEAFTRPLLIGSLRKLPGAK